MDDAVSSALHGLNSTTQATRPAPNTAVQNDLATRPAREFTDILAAALRLYGIHRPYEIDGQTYVTDLCGFLAVQGVGLNPHSAPVKESNIEMSRSLLALSADKTISLSPLREFLQEITERESDSGGCVECRIFGCAVDARIVKKWLGLIPFDECRVAARGARTKQKEVGESLLFEATGWKLLVAGLIPVLKFPPTYDALSIAKAEGR